MINFSSDISSLINMLNANQRERLKNLLNEFEKEGVEDAFLERFDINDIINKINFSNKYDKIREAAKNAAERGETTIPTKQWGVHATHCCTVHGCKYGHEDCPVEMGLVKQEYPCESCSDGDDDY